MDNEKRTGQVPPIPDNYEEIVTELQLATIKLVESFGGKLWFIRRPLFQGVIPVVKCSEIDGCFAAVIEADGTLNKEHGLIIRNDSISEDPNTLTLSEINQDYS